MTKVIPVVLAFVFSMVMANYGGGEGGYSQLPPCNSSYWGQTLAVQGYIWYCPVGGNHWVIR